MEVWPLSMITTQTQLYYKTKLSCTNLPSEHQKKPNGWKEYLLDCEVKMTNTIMEDLMLIGLAMEQNHVHTSYQPFS